MGRYLLLTIISFTLLSTEMLSYDNVCNKQLIVNSQNLKLSMSDFTNFPHEIYPDNFAFVQQNEVFYFSLASSIALQDPLYKIDSVATVSNIVRTVKWEPYDLATVAAQTVGGVVGMVGGTIVAVGIYSMFDGNNYDQPDMGGAIIGLMAGVTLGSPLGVYIAGQAMGGNGSFGFTMLSGVVGIAAFGILAPITSHMELPIILLTNLALPIVTYHATSSVVYYDKISQNNFLNRDLAINDQQLGNVVRLNLVKFNF